MIGLVYHLSPFKKSVYFHRLIDSKTAWNILEIEHQSGQKLFFLFLRDGNTF